MEELMREEFIDGQIWENDIESANEMVANYIKSIGGNNEMVEDILGIIHDSDTVLNKWDFDKIKSLIEDYIDR